MKLFSVPADFRTSTIDRFAELNARYEDAAVCETYGHAPVGGFSGSGRVYQGLPDVDLGKLEKYIAYAASKSIDFNYTLNASCMGNVELQGKGLSRVDKLLSRLWDIGVRHLTVSLPTLMTIIKDSGLPFSIKASAICQIDSAYGAEHYRSLGLDRMVMDVDITRDFRRIRQVCAAFGEGVEMIINNLCVKDCPYTMFHYNHESHFSFVHQDIKLYYVASCRAKSVADPRNIMRMNWVRPEDLPLYESAGIHRFKLQGRHEALNGDVPKAVETYIGGKYSGNLYDLLLLFDPTLRKLLPYYPNIDNDALGGFLKPFFDDPDQCAEGCGSCGHCGHFAVASMDTEANREVLRVSKEKLDKRPGPFDEYRRQPTLKRLATQAARRRQSIVGSVRHFGRHWEA